MNIQPVNPEGWVAPRGYNNGVLVEGARAMLFVAGQIAWDAQAQLVGRDDFAAQFRQALANVRAVVAEAGGVPEHIVRLTVYVTDKRAYLAALGDVGAAYRDVMDRNYPAMALVEVADLLEEGALVEIEATAALP